jgi:hypothetical protein
MILHERAMEEEEWSDEEENSKLVEKINRMSLDELKGIIDKIIPGLTVTGKDG